jgi:maltooligosyltrehalose trehalohydrolase
MIMYELHVGTFTKEGTLEAIIPRLEDLSDLGVNTIELMPISQFPGERNWGYDGAYPFAVQNSYGGPDGLRKLADACHRKKISLIQDVVYNTLALRETTSVILLPTSQTSTTPPGGRL